MEEAIMSRLFLVAWAVFAGVALGPLVHAQTPAAAPVVVPEALPFDIPIGASISLERAKRVAESAAAEARKHNWKMAIAIVNPSGDLVYYEKADDTQLASAEVAPAKARSSALYRRPTKAFFDVMEAGHVYVMTLKGMVASEGGIPLVENGKLVGAIGVSGGAPTQDGVVAKAGVDALK
jgi:glc operon protein GlcG